MDRSAALKGLESERVSTRLEAARVLENLARPEDRAILETRRRSEAVPWVRNALKRAIARTSVPPEYPGGVVAAGTPSDIEDYDGDEAIKGAALRDVAELFIHELRKPLGRALLYAQREIADFDLSKTGEELVRLQQFLDGLEELATATGTATPKEVNLRSLIAEEASVAGELEGAPRIELRGPPSLDVIVDPALIRLVVSNGLRNAVEAVVSAESNQPIIISWGETDREYYMAILDSGPGVSPEAESLFEIGESSKRGHVGFGLALARQASRSLGGEIVLSNLEDGLTRFEMRWARITV